MLRRGEVWWVRLDPTLGSEIAKTRPCVIVSATVVNDRRRTVVVIPLSSSPQVRPPLLVAVHCAGRAAAAVIDQIRAVSKERLESCIGELSAADLNDVEEALKDVLDLS
jgi:mRNA interferase MazF